MQSHLSLLLSMPECLPRAQALLMRIGLIGLYNTARPSRPQTLPLKFQLFGSRDWSSSVEAKGGYLDFSALTNMTFSRPPIEALATIEVDS